MTASIINTTSSFKTPQSFNAEFIPANDARSLDLNRLKDISSQHHLTNIENSPAANTDIAPFDHLLMQLTGLFGDVQKEMDSINERYSLGGLINHGKKIASILKAKKAAKRDALEMIAQYPADFSPLKKKIAFETFELMLSEF